MVASELIDTRALLKNTVNWNYWTSVAAGTGCTVDEECGRKRTKETGKEERRERERDPLPLRFSSQTPSDHTPSDLHEGEEIESVVGSPLAEPVVSPCTLSSSQEQEGARDQEGGEVEIQMLKKGRLRLRFTEWAISCSGGTVRSFSGTWIPCAQRFLMLQSSPSLSPLLSDSYPLD